MNAIALRIDSFFSPHTDRGISDDAESLRTLVKEVHKDVSLSETLGKAYREALDALGDSYRECTAKDWDGNGAAAATLGDLITAERFLRTLPTSLPSPEISVDPDGEFAFEWYNDRDVLSVSIGRANKISYAARFGRSRIHGTEFFGDELPRVIIENLERLFAETFGSSRQTIQSPPSFNTQANLVERENALSQEFFCHVRTRKL